VQEAIGRLSGEGLSTEVQEATTCCFAVQDKVWTNDPDGAPWEYYTVLADASDEVGLGCSTEGCTPVSGEHSATPEGAASPAACC